jgi:LPPG:FO 2-phospho-L-lactate transferase
VAWGGAKLAYGMQAVLGSQLSMVVNTADDFTHWGLHISPDVDTVLYNLAGIENPATGWGLANESWTVLGEMQAREGESWFRLGEPRFGHPFAPYQPAYKQELRSPKSRTIWHTS